MSVYVSHMGGVWRLSDRRYAQMLNTMKRGLEVDLETGLAIERQHFAGVFATEDRTTGMTSFIENGPGKAVFNGR